jgi:hypothetical protein
MKGMYVLVVSHPDSLSCFFTIFVTAVAFSAA